MRDTVRPVLLDVTRLIRRSWSGRRSTGIDRVSYAYLDHFRHRALAVVQLRGVIRVLDHALSEQLFEMLLAPSAGFRTKFTAFVPRILLAGRPAVDLEGLTYLNVSHTDFDMHAHWKWIARKGLRPVVFVHDLIPIRDPQLSRPFAVARHLGRVRAALRYAEQIVVSSNQVAIDLRAYATQQGVECPPLIVAPIAGEAFEVPDPTPVQGDPFFLCVGTIEPRKNHALLFDIWRDLVARLAEQTPRLIVVGQKGPMTGDILAPLNAPEIAPHAELREACTDRELGNLMGGARALLFPSLAEGFGLPLVEALQLGTPVIASDTPIFHEVGQGVPKLLCSSDRQAWAEAIIAHTRYPVSKAERAANAARFDAPRWSDHFDALENAIAPSRLKTGPQYETSFAA